MKKNERKLNHTQINDEIKVELDGFQICYKLQEKDNYAMSTGAATERELLENIENEEASTHILQLQNTDWKTIIHGFVPYEFYLVGSESEKDYRLEMRFKFTGKGVSQRRMEPGIVNVFLGRVCVENGALKLVPPEEVF